MITVPFNPAAGPLQASAVFLGDLVANYEISIRERDSNAQTSLLNGDNLNPENDEVPLPTPSEINDGRRILLETGFCGNHPDESPNYEIRLEIFQNGQMIGANSDSGVLNGRGQFSLLFIKLAVQ